MAEQGHDLETRVPLIVNTIENGYNCGRQYIFSVDDEGRFEEWSQFRAKQAALSYKLHCKHSRTQKTKVRCAMRT